MTVNITMSNQSGGNSLPDNVDLGTVNPNSSTAFQDLFIRHDASAASITDCAFYISRYSATGYLGVDADNDYSEIIGWGDAAAGDGFIINQHATGWTSPNQFPTANDQICSTGSGDINGQLPLLQSAINIGTVTENGVIPIDGEAHIQVRVEIPSSIPAGANYRAVQLIMSYSATS